MACMFAGTGSMGVMAAEKITEAKAKEIALEDAGLSSDEVMFERIEKGTENGASVYEIEFETASEEFDYDIAKAGGKILNASRKVKVPACVAAQEKSNGTNKSGKTGRDQQSMRRLHMQDLASMRFPVSDVRRIMMTAVRSMM